MVNNVGEITSQIVKQDVYAKSLQSCPTLGNALDSSPLGSSVHGTLQARIVELAAKLSWDPPNPEIKPMSPISPALAGEFFTTSTTWEAMK